MRTKLFVFLLLVLTAAFSASRGSVGTASPQFYRDDPLTREPESQDASGAAAGAPQVARNTASRRSIGMAILWVDVGTVVLAP